ncbi:hypothetical protein A33Q_3412 [Indibacter alkaliphilus LW1]|uniref:Uncharacterized protein n=1 Tax=Indibacter alkaliphilus (strain CCUG 57479 / KCTC 22604 / LW1) TaxID=1189612 RepID=S2D7L1_INDAL|nr:hypothetical protein A33Q_3412 [Indibacter alkaliphilus LW1]
MFTLTESLWRDKISGLTEIPSNNDSYLLILGLQEKMNVKTKQNRRIYP